LSNRTSSTSAAAAALVVAFALIAGAAWAYPDGAPWGASDPAADESCASCHYDYDPVEDSSAIAIDGLSDDISAGATYTLELRFAPADARIAAFQLTLRTAGDDPGAFVAGPDDVEMLGGAIRSSKPRTVDGGVSWTVSWRAPDEPGTSVEFLVAASAANDDQSPFGDTIHYRAIRVLAK
jgi:hypothetical protein